MVERSFGAEFHDFAGSVVVHAVGGWIGLAAVLMLGARHGRYSKDGRISAHPPSSIPFLALGAWILTVGWFGFNVMSAQTIDKISGLVAVNSLMAMVGGTLVALWAGKNDPGFVAQRPAGRAGGRVCRFRSDASAWRAVYRRSGRRLVCVDVHAYAEPLEDRRCARCMAAAWFVRRVGRHCCRNFRMKALGGIGGVSFMSQLIGTALGIVIALTGGFIVYGVIKKVVGIRLDGEEEFNGADLSIHKITATPERESGW